jgi:hypothetical protein
MHPARDSVTPTRESVELFLRAGQPTELHLFSDVDHFMAPEAGSPVATVLDTWLARYFVANARA